MAKLRIGIVGGSIAGCAAACELGRDGHDVHVFERADSMLHGAGIGLLAAALARWVERGLLPAELPRSEITQHVITGPAPGAGPLGHMALRQPVASLVVHWNDVQRALRARVPDAAYSGGVTVRGVAQQTPSSATLSFQDGTTADFDLVLFADGHRSLGRALICPESQPQYRGYTLWRGVFPEALLRDSSALHGTLYRVSHHSLPGHSVFYAIPNGASPARSAERLVNCACYLPLSAAELPSFLTDRSGRVRTRSLPPASMRPSEEARLKALMREQLPSYFSELLEHATDTFAQPVYSVAVPRYRRGRLLLLGDAGSLAQPWTGSGVFKAITNVTSLAEKLRMPTELDSALGAWDRGATAAGQALVGLGEHMEQALFWQMPNLATFAPSAALAWWQAASTPAR
jgi:2-polyprenyl-6-methoxyphenol hydroxylase-like FAD-dependent oxidoreductase